MLKMANEGKVKEIGKREGRRYQMAHNIKMKGKNVTIKREG